MRWCGPPLAAGYTDSEQFRLDFADVVGQQHAWLFTEPAPGADTSVMQLDITAMINRALNLTGTPERDLGTGRRRIDQWCIRSRGR